LSRAGVNAEVIARLLEIGNEEVKDLVRRTLSNSKDLRLLPLIVKLENRGLDLGVKASSAHLALLSSAMGGSFEGETELELCYDDKADEYASLLGQAAEIDYNKKMDLLTWGADVVPVAATNLSVPEWKELSLSRLEVAA
jgi:hypothetical protein